MTTRVLQKLGRIMVIWGLGMFLLTPVFAEKAVGWHWYNERYESKKEGLKEKVHKQEKSETKEKSATAQITMLRQTVQEAKARAILAPTVENMRTYLILQNLVTNQASLFTHAWKKTLLLHPELDYSVLHPTQNSAQHIINEQISRKEREALEYFKTKYGMFFFYRGKQALDGELAAMVDGFSRKNQIALIPISVDGEKAAVFATGEVDHGQAKQLGIKHFPALILVEPNSKKVIPLHYGFISESELRRRFLQIATEFQEW